MGLLDDLKKQAEMVKSQQLDQSALQADRLKTVEQKMKQTFDYLGDLFKQLAVLKPENTRAFPVPGMGDLGGMRFVESFIDYRKKRIDDIEYFDSITFYVKWQRPDNPVIESDMLGTIQKARDALNQQKLKYTEESFKNARGVPVIRLTAELAMISNVNINADHVQGRLMVVAGNVTRMGQEHLAIPAPEVSEALLEKFALMLLGQPTDMGKYRVVAPVR